MQTDVLGVITLDYPSEFTSSFPTAITSYKQTIITWLHRTELPSGIKYV